MQAADLPPQNYFATQQADKLSWQTSYSPTGYRSHWQANDVSQMYISEVCCGMHKYPLVRTLDARFAPPTFDRLGLLTVAEMPKALMGQGTSPSLAQQDFELRFHKEFQRLASLRPFEMTSGDAKAWQHLRSIVDVPQHLASTPRYVEAYGTIVKVEHSRLFIHWEDGTRNRISFKYLPANMANMANFGPGQSFRATQKRNWAGQLVQVLSATQCKPLEVVTADTMSRLRSQSDLKQRKTGSWR
jgi:hypothetical protein